MMMITQHSVMEENMSNLTCASGDQASVSSGGNHYFVQQPPKKKRNLPGNPDPDAEVISLSPKTLMATNRFVCEICKKGFQRDQNLQLHRRGHNLPWKLKQRNSKDVIRKKVYVCPEASCVHHDPSRALGDLTGIKKHFSRKHGEKKWKCEKCTKCYAVKSDWKAHFKICGTREYRCDCGTLFSRRDSFITHRGFCDAIAEESAKSIATAHILNLQVQPHSFNTMKKEEETFTTCPQAQTQLMNYHHHFNVDSNLNPSPGGPINMMSPTTGGGHMSATALLQKATQMGATMSSTSDSTGFGLHMSSRDQHHGFLSSSGNKAADDHQVVANSFLQDMMMMMMSQGSFVDDHHQTFDQDYGFDDHNIDDNHDQIVGISGNQDDGMTRDFLGLRPLSHAEILSIAAARNAPNGADDHQDHLN